MSTTFRFQEIKRYKRGAKWSDGSTRLCTRCGINKAEGSRKKQAVVTAVVVSGDTGYKLPVAYCEDDIPEEIMEKVS